MQAEPAAATRYTGTYLGRADQVHHVRRAVASYLAGCLVADAAVLIVCELASNAILHSRSRAEFFIVRAELHPAHVRVKAEDLGGPWRREAARRPPARPGHSGSASRPGRLGRRDDRYGRRIVWARLDLARGTETRRHHPAQSL
jgi:hypothetical protein